MQELITLFSQEMLKKIEMRKDRYTDMGWKSLDRKRLVSLLKAEIDEFQLANDNQERKDEAIDIANYALFLWALSE